MGLKAAIDRVSTWTVVGVTNLGYYQDVIASGDLPALVVRLAGTGGEALRPLNIQADQGRVTVHVVHYLITTGLGLGLVEERFYGALAHVDNYLSVVVNDLMLGGALLEPLAIADIYEGAIDLGNVIYYGVTFRHRWVLKVV